MVPTCTRLVDALSAWHVDQDEQLDDLARVVTNTRHIALAVNDELDLHARLLVRARVVSLGGGCRHAC